MASPKNTKGRIDAIHLRDLRANRPEMFGRRALGCQKTTICPVTRVKVESMVLLWPVVFGQFGKADHLFCSTLRQDHQVAAPLPSSAFVCFWLRWMVDWSDPEVKKGADRLGLGWIDWPGRRTGVPP